MKLLLDIVEYKSKPNGKEAEITNRIIKNPVSLTLEELSNEIIKGKTFVPSYIDTPYNGEIRRKKECWTSQELLCLDFDNEILVPDPYNKGKKIKVKHVSITIEDALNEFKDTAAFIYKTFNHTDEHPKFRVVFKLSEIVSDYMVMQNIFDDFYARYPHVDKKCLEGSRLFYGGKEVIVIDYNNCLDISPYKCDNSKNNGGGFRDYDMVRYNNFNTILVTKTPHEEISREKQVSYRDNLDLIRDRKIELLHNQINSSSIKFYTYAETVNYIKKQDLAKLLGIHTPRKFPCIFHYDTNPSASIFQNEVTGDHIYCCQSSNCTFGTGTVTKCIERLLICNRVQALKFLRQVYKIDFHHTEWQKEQLDILDENMRYIQSVDFQQEYPNQYALIKNYIDDLVKFIGIAKDYLPPEHYSQEHSQALFFASLQHYADVCGKSKNTKRIGDRIALFTYFKYIYKLSEDEIPEELLKKAKKELVKNRGKLNKKTYNLVSYYSIPSYSEEILTFAENKAQEYKDHHFTMRAISREMFARALGEEEANRIYPQTKGKKISKLSHTVTSEMENAALELVNSKGWATEKEILSMVENKINTNKTFKEVQIKKILGEMVNKYGLVRKRSNNMLLKMLGIPVIISENGNPSYPFIIFSSDYELG